MQEYYWWIKYWRFYSKIANRQSLLLANISSYTVYDFHCEQGWTKWVHKRKHGLLRCDGDLLLKLLRDCAWAPSGKKDAVDYHYQEAVKRLARFGKIISMCSSG